MCNDPDLYLLLFSHKDITEQEANIADPKQTAQTGIYNCQTHDKTYNMEYNSRQLSGQMNSGFKPLVLKSIKIMGQSVHDIAVNNGIFQSDVNNIYQNVFIDNTLEVDAIL